MHPSHKAGILSILGLDSGATRQAVSDALIQWNSKEFEDEAARNNMCATAFRTFQEWNEHPHGQAIKNTPPVQLIKIADAPKRMPIAQTFERGPLQTIRVLDLTRVIAGPVCGRTLAAHGADALWITSRKLPSLPSLDPDTSRGKRTTQLDLTSQEGRDTLFNLAKEGDVFLQAYRPNGLHEKGFGASALANLRPGIVYASLRAWGWDGPWQNRRGFDSLVQTATGFNHDEAIAFASFKGITEEIIKPKPFPVQTLDHAAGYLLAFGIQSALCKTITEGGSWEVRVSLVGVGNWVRSLGRLGPEGFNNVQEIPPNQKYLTRLRIPSSSKKGIPTSNNEAELEEDYMIAVKHSAILEETPGNVTEAPVSLARDSPIWIARDP